jgi:hypothetical protein
MYTPETVTMRWPLRNGEPLDGLTVEAMADDVRPLNPQAARVLEILGRAMDQFGSGTIREKGWQCLGDLHRDCRLAGCGCGCHANPLTIDQKRAQILAAIDNLRKLGETI